MSTYTDLFGFDVASPEYYSRNRLPRPAPPDTGADSTPGRICWGQVGALPSPELAPTTGFEVVDCDEKHAEVSREEEEVRITNPDDDTQYIDVNRASKLLMNKTEKKFKPVDNTSAADPEGFGDFAPSSIDLTSFKPLGTESTQKCKLTVTLKNGPRSV